MSKKLLERTKIFSIGIIDAVEGINYSPTKQVVLTQLLRSATSVGANYRPVCRSRSDKVFIAKLHV